MSGYAAAARISGASPRFVVGARRPEAPLIELAAAVSQRTTAETIVDVRAFDPSAPAGPGWTMLIERWAAFRERWAQLTFYLSSGDSWR